MNKKAFDWSQVGTAALGSLLAVAAGTFADEIVDWLKENNLKGKSKDYYQAMLDAHPQLKKEDPKLVAKYWASLFHFAPYMAQDPLAAGAYIRQTLRQLPNEEFGGPTVDTYSTLANINKAIADVKLKKTRGIGTEIGVGTASRVLGDVMTQNLTPSRPQVRDSATGAIKNFKKQYERDRNLDWKRAQKMANKFRGPQNTGSRTSRKFNEYDI